MSETASVSLWIEQLKEGDEDAATELWNRYVAKLISLAEFKLRNSSKRTADEEDLAVSAFNACLTGIREDRFKNLKSRNDLWQVLIMLTERKAVDQIRRQLSQKRGGGQVRGESIFEAASSPSAKQKSPGISSVVDSNPSPEFATYFAENVQLCMNRLSDDISRRIVLLKLEGYTNKEVAAKTEISLSSVERKLRVIRQLWDEASPQSDT